MVDYEKHHDVQAFGNEAKNIIDEGIRNKRTADEIKKNIAAICTKCLLPVSEDCEICLGHTTTDELYREFNK